MENNNGSINQMENVLNSIPGIISSKIVFNENNEIEEMHIMATTDRNPKQISRDIQSVMLAKFDVNFDHKKISIAQVTEPTLQKPDRRIEIEEISYSLNGNMIRVGVKLKQDGTIFEAHEEGYNTVSNNNRVIAGATIKALQQMIQGNWVFSIEDIERSNIAKQDIIIAAVSVINFHQEELLVGTAIIKNDLREAVVKATLDAINRKLIKLTI
ncbi:hypothetical protein [Alkaliphilus crotonatoxidans]